MNNKVNILGVDYDNFSRSELSEFILESIDKGVKFSISLSNPEFIIRSRNDEQLKNYLNDFAKYNVADGIGVVLASKLLGKPLKERVTGTDFIDDICKIAEQNSFKVFFFGGMPGTAAKAEVYFKNKYNDLKVVGTHHGFHKCDSEVIQTINKSNADILVVCLGCPNQEKWIKKNRNEVNAIFTFGNGGAFDYYAENVKRAPLFIRKLGFEWLYRLYQDPSYSRFKRQISTIPVFTYLVSISYIKNRFVSILKVIK